MTLTKALAQVDLDPFDLELEAFMEAFDQNRVGPFSAKVNYRDGVIHVGGTRDGWMLPHRRATATWYTLTQDGGHPLNPLD